MSVRVGARVAPSSGVRKLRRPVATAAAPSFNPLTDWTTAPIHGVWASDPAWTPPADGGAVSSWRNGGSVGTPDLTQGTSAAQPTYRSSTAAFNNQSTVQGDGTDDYLTCDTADVSQPVHIVMVAAKGKSATSREALVELVGAAPSVASIYTHTTGKWNATNGIVNLASAGNSDTSPHLFRVTATAAVAALFVDETSVATGTWATGTFKGITMFGPSVGFFSSGHVALYLAFNTDPTALPEWVTFKAWVTTTYGITVA